MPELTPDQLLRVNAMQFAVKIFEGEYATQSDLMETAKDIYDFIKGESDESK